MARSEESQEEEEYEVEYITMAKVQGKGKNKQWVYQVKWKNYGIKDNTWEPITSFEGSEHFIESFWAKIRDKRDRHDISRFEENETLLPTGPPPRKHKKPKTDVESAPKPQSEGKEKSSSSPSGAKTGPKGQPLSSSRASHKRKFSELEVEDTDNPENSSETEVRSIIGEPASRGRPGRRTENVQHSGSGGSRINRRKSHHIPEADEEIEEGISSKRQRSNAALKASETTSARTRLSKAKPKSESKNGPSAGRTRVSTSRPRPTSSRGRAPASSSRPTKRQKATASSRVEKDPSPDVILLDDEGSVPDSEAASLSVPEAAPIEHHTDAVGELDVHAAAMQVDYPDTGAEADIEDEIMQVEQVKQVPEDDLFEVPTSDIIEQQVTLEPETEREDPMKFADNTILQSLGSKLPAHRARAANPRIKIMEDDVKDDGPSAISTKARIAKRVSNNAEAGPSSKSDRSSSTKKRVKPGPGRSSSGFQLGSTSVLAVVKKGALQTLKKLNPYSRSSPEAEASAPAQVADDPSEPEPVPTGEQLLQLGGLNVEDAGQLPDFEDADAEGEFDSDIHDTHESSAATKVAPLQKPGGAERESEDVNAEAEVGTDIREVEIIVMSESVENAVAENPDGDLYVVTARGTIVNPPDTVIGRGGDVAAWKQTTIFGPLGLGRDGPASPTLPEASPSESAQHAFSITLTSVKRLPVILKDVHAPSTSDMQPLDAIVTNTNADPPGCFYKDKHADSLIDVFRTEGSCARVAKDPTMDEAQRQDFEQFSARLKQGGLYLATINGHVLVFCSSENATIGSRLGMSPNLIGLGDNVLVSEVVIKDEGAYCDAVLNADDGSW